MSEIISTWVSDRLDLIVDMTPENFAITTANGILLAQILQSYQIITTEEVNLLKDSTCVEYCHHNFNLINAWLQNLNLAINDEDLYEIIHGVGFASLYLFYELFLKLKDKTKLIFLSQNAQLRERRLSRFNFKKIDTSDEKLNLHREELCVGDDVHHWLKDRMETEQILKTDKSLLVHQENLGKESAFILPPVLCDTPNLDLTYEQIYLDLASVDDKTYEELIKQQEEAKELPPFIPNPKEVKKIMKHLHVKNKVRLENQILKKQLNQDIMTEFDTKIKDRKDKSEDCIKMLLKQALFEKELTTKLGLEKLQKDYMVENKNKKTEIMDRFKEKEFIDAILLKDKELDSELNETKLAYYLEQEKKLQLHRQIWEERIKRRAKRHEELCFKSVKSIVDISVKIGEFKRRFGREPNKRETQKITNLFISGQSIFDVCKPVISITKDVCANEIPETIITAEMTKQNSMDMDDFVRYMQYERPWELKNINVTPETFEQISCGLNVLGYIVHRSLEIKYPAWVRDKPDIPDTPIRVCINGLSDTSILPGLRNLLSARYIKIIELNQVVDFCIEAFKRESKVEYDDDTVPVKEALSKKKKQAKPKNDEKSKKKKKGAVESVLVESTRKKMENKLVQTPIIYPCEEIPFTVSGLLGKTAQELLDDGETLEDFLLMDMFVEYLKSFPVLKGWVLINFPTTLKQATILEALDTKKLSNSFFKENIPAEQIDERESCSLYDNADIERTSRLLPNPVCIEPVNEYDTVLTAYIKIRKLSFDDKTADGVLAPGYEELGVEPDPLDRFYSRAGVNYSLFYKEFDLVTIKYLGKLIIGDFSLPLKSQDELFGDVTNLDIRPSKGGKSAKAGEQHAKTIQKRPTRVKNKTLMKVEAKDKKGKTKFVITYEDKSTQIPTDDEEVTEEVLESKSTVKLPTAGEEGWEYSKIDSPEKIIVPLASLWENIEDTYINDLKQIFFFKRRNKDSIMPFVRYVKTTMRKVIDRPDYKGFYLAKFQQIFNTFDMKTRKDDDFKEEMHCRIEHFKEKLAEMCDVSMMESENMRGRLIKADYIQCQIAELMNNCINLLQIEINRFKETMHFINNYYLGVFNEVITDEDVYNEEPLPKFHGIYNQVINSMLQDIKSEISLTYFEELLHFVIHKMYSSIKKMNFLTAYNLEKTVASQEANQYQYKSKSKAGKTSTEAITITEQDISTAKYASDKLIEEWQCAAKGEVLRIFLRIDLINYNAFQYIKEFLYTLQQSFHEIYNEIRSNYFNEMENVEAVCNVFRSAVENEIRVEKEFVFDKHTCCNNPAENLFDNPVIIPKLSKEIVKGCAFTIAQLSKLTDIFLDLYPSGYTLRSTFTFILQDIIWITPKNDAKCLSPRFWRKLDIINLRKLIDSLYDDLEYVYWKDFIIYNIRMKYPSEKELLATRKALRRCDPYATELIQDRQFFATKLWFEYLFKREDLQKIIDIKRLLYKMYNIKNYGINYTAMLLDFCKDERSVEGFSKALALSTGKMICYHKDIGNNFKEEYLRSMKQHEENVRKRDEERDEYYKAAYEEVSKLIDYVVHITEDIIIEDITTEVQKETVIKQPSREYSKQGDIVDVSKNSLVEDLPHEEQSTTTVNSQIVKVYKELPDNVGTESVRYTEMSFFLSLDVLITVIMAAIPYHSRVETIKSLSYWETAAEIFDKCKNPDFNFSVLSHEFLNSSMFLDLLALTKKFKSIDPVRVVKDVLDKMEICCQ